MESVSTSVTDVVRAVGYVRVSTDEQASSGLGLSAQREAIEAECDRRLWHLSSVHEDAGSSGSTMARAGLASALAEVEASRGVLIVAKLDRLTRSLLDFAQVMADSQDKGWALVALDLGVDTSTPAGEFMAAVMASAAQWERRIIGARTREALAVRRAQGVRLGRPRVVPVAVSQDIADQRESGATWAAIAEDLNRRGVPTAHGGARWYPATARQVAMSRTAAEVDP